MQNRRHPLPKPVKFAGFALLAYAAVAVWAMQGSLLKDAPGGDDSMVRDYLKIAPPLYAVCGIFILRGANWARILFFGACAPAILAALIAQGKLPAVVYMLLPLVLALFLISKNANRFFAGRDTLFNPKTREQQRREHNEHRRGRYDY
jgi:hypothetical protein